MSVLGECVSRSEEETDGIAERLARELSPGETLHLVGELGVGKTRFVRALAGALGHDVSVVSSPTYAVANTYETAGAVTVVHADAYRLGDTEDALGLLADFGLDGAWSDRAIVAIEWADRLGSDVLDESRLRATVVVRLEHAGEGVRRVRVERVGG